MRHKGGRSPSRDGRVIGSKGLLRGVREVEEAVRVVMLSIDFQDRLGEGGHAPIVDYEEDGLGGREPESVAKALPNLSVTDNISLSNLLSFRFF